MRNEWLKRATSSVVRVVSVWKTAPAPWLTWGAGWLLSVCGEQLARFGAWVIERASGWLVKRHADPNRTFWTWAEIIALVIGCGVVVGLLFLRGR